MRGSLLQTDTATALISPPNNPGMPCKLWTPAVSCRPILSLRQSCKYENDRLETMPPNAPTIKHAPGLVNMPEEAPIITPPANVAFQMWSMKNFSCNKAVIVQHERLLAVRARIVLVMIILLSQGVTAKKAALKLGQNIHRKKVPMRAKMLEMQVILGLSVGQSFLPNMKLTARPKQAPKVWMVVLPPASIMCSTPQTMASFKEQPMIWMTDMMSSYKGPTLPRMAPKAMSMEATEQEAAMKDFSLMRMNLSCQPWKTLSQKADVRMQNWTAKELMKKVQERADQAYLLMKVMRNPNPISIMTLMSWQKGQKVEVRAGSFWIQLRTKTEYNTKIIIYRMIRQAANRLRLARCENCMLD